MRNHLWLLTAFTVAATLALGAPDADAAPQKSAKAAKTVKAQAGPTAAELWANYKLNTKDCDFEPSPPRKHWGWKNARLTAHLIKTDTGYVTEILSGQKNVSEKLPIASITKFMTASVILEAVDKKELSLDQMIDVTPESKCLNDNFFAMKGLPKGITQISVGDALTHVLKKSSNTMAENLAIARSGSIEAFVALMNAKAKQWEMNDTNFINPHGLPKGDRKAEHTTALDMLKMGQHLSSDYARLKKYSQAPLKPWTVAEDYNYNKMQLTYLGAIFKTATIDECSSLLTIAEAGENKIINIELCGTRANTFQNAFVAVKGGLKRIGEMVFTPAMAAEKSPAAQQITVSSRPAQPSDP